MSDPVRRLTFEALCDFCERAGCQVWLGAAREVRLTSRNDRFRDIVTVKVVRAGTMLMTQPTQGDLDRAAGVLLRRMRK